MALQPIFEVCARERGYEGGGGGALEYTMVAPGGPGNNSQGNLIGGYLAGGKLKAGQEEKK